MKSVFIVLPLLNIVTALNHPSCYKILNTWWDKRTNHISSIKTSDWDNVCSIFNGDREACINTGVGRDDYNVTDKEKNTPCVMLGAHSDLCVSNPCNHFNTGKCTLQHTGGLCNWITKKQAKKFGLQYGCQRNPCHIGGLGKTDPDECEERGIPGLMECTYCKIKDKGMGCQRVDVTTSAKCAPVNEDVAPKSSIWIHRKKKSCQCSNNIQLCLDEIASDKNYVKRFP